MTHFADGSSYSYLAEALEDGLVNIGWLDASEPFRQGTVSSDFTAALAQLCRQGLFRTRGLHRCNLCPHPDGPGLPPPTSVSSCGDEFFVGGAEVRVSGQHGVTYAAPDMIIHYVEVHAYRAAGRVHRCGDRD
jgi:hypothetical protein